MPIMNTNNTFSFSDTKLYIFDLQQTLLNDFEPHFEAHKAILTQYYQGNIQEALDEIIQLWGMSVFDIYKKLFGTTLSDNEIHTLVERRDQIYIDIFTRSQPQLCEGAKEALMVLKSKNYAIAVVSGIRRNLLELALKKSHLFVYIDYLLGADDTKKSKPDPEPFLLAASHFHLPPQQCVMIGDSFLDMRGAKKAGMKAIGVVTGFTAKNELVAEGADGVIDTLRELPKFITT
jgi:HAD superfamily hydrolase (TIGR01509 family)